MGNIREMNIENQTCYFFDGMINIKDFDPNLLKYIRKSNKNIDIYYFGYIIVRYSYYVKINNVNHLYLIFNEIDGYIKEKNGSKCLIFNSVNGYIKERNGSKYLVFNSANENSEVLNKCNELWDGIKNRLRP